ncbi:FAD-linked sulfhydryl oxidase ALR [Gaeumannomyces tritici R3-111a-1]|uniref:Sulfhydryl oxidase n=1 Tax=Gaeumannomyces tritici (strain R3-111a-1) TaxID=644352 RepID=J3PC22_GAET3|nr:FAD-linked sulfhydryl oxidase ALR [Gaeumannomyces tritici R3-111a-1]EJT71792.1 FAD-linked sulfhydryl oxidase ALR [Gaeumannomyces tritici R3-111a-1]
MARRQHLTLVVAFSIVAFLTFTYMLSSSGSRLPNTPAVSLGQPPSGKQSVPDQDASKPNLAISPDILTGGSIAPKLENATLKAELGRASWKLFHTMMARFPEKPSEDDSLALKTYIQLFARLYPCGDCASHFQKMLKQYPPQTSSRNAAAGWACFVHNQVNQRLKKKEFDCAKIGDFYDCGCGDDKGKKKDARSAGDGTGLTLEKEGLTRGG